MTYKIHNEHIYIVSILFKKIKWVTTDRKDHPISGLRGLEEMLREYFVISKNILGQILVGWQ